MRDMVEGDVRFSLPFGVGPDATSRSWLRDTVRPALLAGNVPSMNSSRR